LSFNRQLLDGLAQLKALLRDAEQPWWIIGSVAVALHGRDPGPIRDVDVVLGHADAARLLSRLDLPNLAASGDALFRSDLFARWTEPSVEVELMAGLQVKTGRRWKPLVIRSREEVADGLFVPSREELRAILRSFGREKDLQRAATLG
jgi:hypothetical protein